MAQPFQSLFPPQTALAIWTREVAPRLAAKHDVVVYHVASSGDEPRREEGVEYRPISLGRDVKLQRLLERAWPRLIRSIDQPYVASGLYLWGFWRNVANAAARQRADVIHVFNASQALPHLRTANPRAKLVLHMQCEWLSQLDRSMIEERIKRADAIVGCSDYITDKIRARFPEFAPRCRTVYNGTSAPERRPVTPRLPEPFTVAGVDVTSFGTDTTARSGARPERLRLLFVGRISPEKGIHVLLDAFRRAASGGLDIELVVVGDEAKIPPGLLARLDSDERVRGLESFFSGPFADGYLKHLLDDLPMDIRGRLFFAGGLSYPEVLDAYGAADVFVFPSISDAFGIPVIEAMSAGVPVVASRVGGIPELVEDGESGVLIEPDDPQLLAEALLELAQDAGRRAAMGAKGRERVEQRFTWDRIAKQTLALYSDLLPELTAPELAFVDDL